MEISGIYTIRDTPQPTYWDIVFEWEDQISQTLNVPLVYVGKRYDKIYQPGFGKKILNRLNIYQWIDRYFLLKEPKFLAFHIGPPGVYSFYTSMNVIPIIIDFWKHEDINRLEKIFKYSKVVFVTSKEVHNYLKSIQARVTLEHLSLSIPDKYLKLPKGSTKDIDIIQIGRSNALFNEYVNKFLEMYPSTHYVSAKKINDEVEIVSNKHGSIGKNKSRAEFMNLLQRSKISLVSAPGIDEDRKRTGGFSPLTPRFFEGAACGCRLIGLYPQNEDFKYYGISQICPSVNTFSEFKSLVMKYLAESKTPDFRTFLENHLTSKKTNELLNKLRKAND